MNSDVNPYCQSGATHLRRIISLLLALAMCFSLASVAIAAEDEATEDLDSADIDEAEDFALEEESAEIVLPETEDEAFDESETTMPEDECAVVSLSASEAMEGGCEAADSSESGVISDEAAAVDPYGVSTYSVNVSTSDTIKVTGTSNYTNAYAVLDLVNQERKAAGLSSLTMDSELLDAAMQRAAECSVYYSHTRPDGSLCFTATSLASGENIAAGQTTASFVMNTWMNSEGHRANILGSGYKSIGIGCFVQNGVTYWVQMFGYGSAASVSKSGSSTKTYTIPISSSVCSGRMGLTSSSSSTMTVGDTATYSARVYNDFMYCTPDNSSLKWSSSDTSVATVSSSGKVTAKGGGTAKITAKSSNGGMSASVTVTVYLATPKLKSVSNVNGGVKVTWGSVSGAAKYRVFRKTSGGSWKKVGDTASTSYTDKTAKSGTKYIYTVRCIDSNGKSYTSKYDTTGLSITYIAAPTLKSVSASSSGITIKWGSVTGASKYRVFRKTGSGSWKKLKDTTSLSYTDKTAKAGTTYTYTVRCVNSKGTSYTSGYNSTGLKLKYAATPKLSGVSNVNGGVKITWNKAAGAAKYRVFRKTSGGSWKKVADTTSLSYTDKTAKNNTKYTYTVRCVTSDGKTYAGGYNSSGKSITYLSAPTLKSVSGSSDGVTIKWNKVSGAANYRVFRKTSGGSWKKLKDTTSLSYTDKTAEAGTTYIYTVRCINSKGTAYTSGYDSSGLKLKYAATPKISSLTSNEEGVVIKWSAAAGAAKYKVFRRSSSSDSWKAVGTTTSTSYTDKTVAGKEKTTYYYTVRCVTSDGKTYTGGYTKNGKSIKTGYYKSSTTAAYDEPVYEETDVYVCSQCGYLTTDMTEMTSHLANSASCTDYTVKSQTVQIGTIHHDAVTTKTWVTNKS